MTLRRFLLIRYLALLGWLVLLAVGVAGATWAAGQFDGFVSQLAALAVMAGCVVVGLVVQAAVIRAVDPYGSLRAQVAHESRRRGQVR